MRFLVTTPHDALRPVLADLRARGARIGQVGGGAGSASVRGEVALDRVLGYATQLRDQTRGRATATFVVDRFAVPSEGEGGDLDS